MGLTLVTLSDAQVKHFKDAAELLASRGLQAPQCSDESEQQYVERTARRVISLFQGWMSVEMEKGGVGMPSITGFYEWIREKPPVSLTFTETP